jgi:hypothetical protein
VLAYRCEHPLDCPCEIPVFLAEEVLEQLQTVSVHQVVQDHRIVERMRCKVLVRWVLQRQGTELVLRHPKESFTVIERRAGAVGLAQPRSEAPQEIGEYQRVAPIRCRHLHRLGVVAAGEELHGAPRTNEVGERFVEVGVSADVTGVVQQLVDDDVR